ncbi:hypothetical protein RRG08_061698 [Elysia crispata]|uniref:Uncharacterized protein n=1 Tax=Elysia crispata TaxID=231223 RepID=A0AAE0XVY0_9GAST|nr:hypothetical protein RRG08_061698 [Elysia crispata]
MRSVAGISVGELSLHPLLLIYMRSVAGISVGVSEPASFTLPIYKRKSRVVFALHIRLVGLVLSDVYSAQSLSSNCRRWSRQSTSFLEPPTCLRTPVSTTDKRWCRPTAGRLVSPVLDPVPALE